MFFLPFQVICPGPSLFYMYTLGNHFKPLGPSIACYFYTIFNETVPASNKSCNSPAKSWLKFIYSVFLHSSVPYRFYLAYGLLGSTKVWLFIYFKDILSSWYPLLVSKKLLDFSSKFDFWFSIQKYYKSFTSAN